MTDLPWLECSLTRFKSNRTFVDDLALLWYKSGLADQIEFDGKQNGNIRYFGGAFGFFVKYISKRSDGKDDFLAQFAGLSRQNAVCEGMQEIKTSISMLPGFSVAPFWFPVSKIEQDNLYKSFDTALRILLGPNRYTELLDNLLNVSGQS